MYTKFAFNEELFSRITESDQIPCFLPVGDIDTRNIKVDEKNEVVIFTSEVNNYNFPSAIFKLNTTTKTRIKKLKKFKLETCRSRDFELDKQARWDILLSSTRNL